MKSLAVAGLGVMLLGLAATRDGGPELTPEARRYAASTRALFLEQARGSAADGQLAGVGTTELVNRGAAYCAQLEATASSLGAVFALQQAGDTHPGDVYVIASARRQLCPTLVDDSFGIRAR